MNRCPDWEALDVRKAAPDGPVAFSADLSPASLLAAYRAGVYPFPASDEYTRVLNEVVFADQVEEGHIPLVGRNRPIPTPSPGGRPTPGRYCPSRPRT